MSTSEPGQHGAGSRRRGGRRGPAQSPPPAGSDDELRQDPESVARRILLQRLTAQPRTRAELADLLAERGIPEEIAGEVLDRFDEVGLIDDAAFARAWVESRHHTRGLAGRALAAELHRRGVDHELVREAVAELDDERQQQTARMLIRRKLVGMRRLDRQRAARRLLGMLARKGYPAGLASRIVSEELPLDAAELAVAEPD